MEEKDYAQSPLWRSAQPMVADLYRLIHQNAVRHKGQAFTFDYLIHINASYCHYRSGLFSSGWQYTTAPSSDPVASGWYHEKEALFQSAVNVLKTYIASYTPKTIEVQDTRPNPPKNNDSGYIKTEYYMTVSVNSVMSWAIYQYYDYQGKEFKERIQTAHNSVLQALANHVVNSLIYGHSVTATNGKKIFFDVRVENTRILCGNGWKTYESFGLVPLTKMYQCYGLLLALLETIATGTRGLGDFSSSVFMEGPYLYDSSFGCAATVTFEYQKRLNQW